MLRSIRLKRYTILCPREHRGWCSCGCAVPEESWTWVHYSVLWCEHKLYEIWKTKALLEENSIKTGEVLEKLTEKPTKFKHVFVPNGGYCLFIDENINVNLKLYVNNVQVRYIWNNSYIWTASPFQLLKLENLQRWSLFTLIYNRSSNIWIISYIPHIISLLTGDMNSINWPRLQCVASQLSW